MKYEITIDRERSRALKALAVFSRRTPEEIITEAAVAAVDEVASVFTNGLETESPKPTPPKKRTRKKAPTVAKGEMPVGHTAHRLRCLKCKGYFRKDVVYRHSKDCDGTIPPGHETPEPPTAKEIKGARMLARLIRNSRVQNGIQLGGDMWVSKLEACRLTGLSTRSIELLSGVKKGIRATKYATHEGGRAYLYYLKKDLARVDGMILDGTLAAATREYDRGRKQRGD